MSVKLFTFISALFVSVLSAAAFKPALLHFAADNEAAVYLNGHKISTMNSWPYFATIKMDVKPGDVLSIIAKDFGDPL